MSKICAIFDMSNQGHIKKRIKMQTLQLPQHYVTVKAVKEAGIYIWEREAIYTYQWIGGKQKLSLYGFFCGINKSDGLVDCGNGVWCKPQDECFLENLTHVE